MRDCAMQLQLRHAAEHNSRTSDTAELLTLQETTAPSCSEPEAAAPKHKHTPLTPDHSRPEPNHTVSGGWWLALLHVGCHSCPSQWPVGLPGRPWQRLPSYALFVSMSRRGCARLPVENQLTTLALALGLTRFDSGVHITQFRITQLGHARGIQLSQQW